MLKEFQIAVQSVNISHSIDAKSSQMTLYVNIPVKFPLQELYQQLSKLENVSEIKITQDY